MGIDYPGTVSSERFVTVQVPTSTNETEGRHKHCTVARVVDTSVNKGKRKAILVEILLEAYYISWTRWLNSNVGLSATATSTSVS